MNFPQHGSMAEFPQFAFMFLFKGGITHFTHIAGREID